jgi:ribosomal protein S18 acetylase RimI-like enzyme
MTTLQMSIAPVTSVTAAEQDAAVAVITRAFSDDPVCRWILPDAGSYEAYFPQVVRAFGGAAFGRGTAFRTEGLEGVALWLPPGSEPDVETMGALIDEAVPDAAKPDVFGFLEQQAAYHPAEPLWYLPLIGVDPSQRGLGHGSSLLRHALRECDRQHLAAYLEATSPLNKALYERHGFEEIGVIQCGSSPPMWPMIRRPR